MSTTPAAPRTLGSLRGPLAALADLLHDNPHLRVQQVLVSDHHDDGTPALTVAVRVSSWDDLQTWADTQPQDNVDRLENDEDAVACWSTVGADVTVRADLHGAPRPTIDTGPVVAAVLDLAARRPHLPLDWLTISATAEHHVPVAAAATATKADALAWLPELGTWSATFDPDTDALSCSASGTVNGSHVCAWAFEPLTCAALPPVGTRP